MRSGNILRILLCTSLIALVASVASAAAAPAKVAAASGNACASYGFSNLTFGPNTPYQSAQYQEGKCYCGAKDGVSPQQAQKNGWYASCNNGACVCNYAPGTVASNACCGPFGNGCKDQGYASLTFGPNVPYQSASFISDKCYCGANSTTSPQQAQQNGWYASCNNGACVCNYKSGTSASNVCCHK
jgi:hypothetical protein